jgi:tetratricopeptide (TPR) repeat protein
MLLGLTLLAGAGGLYHLRQMEHLVGAMELVVQQLERRTTEAERATAALQSSLRETRHSQWAVLQQLNLKAAALLQTGQLDQVQQRGLIQTIRRHFQSRLQELDPSEEDHAVALATALDRWCQLEEQHGFVTEALADSQRFDQLTRQFSTLTALRPLVRARDLRQVRLLDRLHRWDEATRQVDLLLDQERVLPDEAGLAAVTATVGQHARLLAGVGQTATARQLVDRALAQFPGPHNPSRHDPALAGELIELQWLGIELRPTAESAGGELSLEADWLRTVRERFSQPRTNDPAGALLFVKLAQRLVSLTASRSPQVAEELSGLWRREIERLSMTALPAERVVQSLDWADQCGQLASQTSGGVARPMPDWEAARDGALQFLAQHPADRSTRQRVSELLIRRSKHQLTRDPAAALAEAGRAIELLTALAGRAELAEGSTAQWIEAHRVAAAACRSLGRLDEARAALEQVYSQSDRDSRDAVVVELVALCLAEGDRPRAEQFASRILDDGPARAEANRLLHAAASASVEPR